LMGGIYCGADQVMNRYPDEQNECGDEEWFHPEGEMRKFLARIYMFISGGLFMMLVEYLVVGSVVWRCRWGRDYLFAGSHPCWFFIPFIREIWLIEK
jgi:hypothetical protein